MNINETVEKLSSIGLKPIAKATGHVDYTRVFIATPDGVQIGRAVIHKGRYSHMNWYGEDERRLGKYDFYVYSWKYLLQTDKRLTRNIWNSVVKEAKHRAQEEYNSKKAWREANPKYDKNGEIKKRKRLQPPNVKKYIWGLIFELDVDNPATVML